MSFHQFNSTTGRLKQSTQLQALSPLLPRPLQKVDLPKMVYDTVKTKPVKTSPPAKSYSTLCPKIAKLQKEMQADLTKPVYLIRGTPDKILFGLTCVLLLGSCINTAYQFTVLKKKFK
ncbi:hypothetical protein ANTQUA_LOCUS87 [Anthophora quadrimaculata]